MIMFDGVIYDCPIANCRTPIFTGKCRKDCIEKYKKEIDIKPPKKGGVKENENQVI